MTPDKVMRDRWHGLYKEGWGDNVLYLSCNPMPLCLMAPDHRTTVRAILSASVLDGLTAYRADFIGERLSEAGGASSLCFIVDQKGVAADRTLLRSCANIVSARACLCSAVPTTVCLVGRCIRQERLLARRTLFTDLLPCGYASSDIQLVKHGGTNDRFNIVNHAPLRSGRDVDPIVLGSPGPYAYQLQVSCNSADIFWWESVCCNREATPVDAGSIIKEPDRKDHWIKNQVGGNHFFVIWIEPIPVNVLSPKVEPTRCVDPIISLVLSTGLSNISSSQVEQFLILPFQIIKMFDACNEGHSAVSIDRGIT